MKNKIIIIGIAGGSGSGKTRLVKNILNKVDHLKVDAIELDSYYKDLSHLIFSEREKNNFDHPHSVDFNLLQENLEDLINNREISVPIYDYKTHTREKNTSRKINNINVIILEGIFALYTKEIRDLMAIKIFVDTPSDIRILRRIKRDVHKRERSIDSVMTQYEETVRPMFIEFVRPTQRYADIIIPYGGKNKISIDTIVTTIKNYYI
jgi:uridine kinase